MLVYLKETITYLSFITPLLSSPSSLLLQLMEPLSNLQTPHIHFVFSLYGIVSLAFCLLFISVLYLSNSLPPTPFILSLAIKLNDLISTLYWVPYLWTFLLSSRLSLFTSSLSLSTASFSTPIVLLLTLITYSNPILVLSNPFFFDRSDVCGL